MSPILQRAKTKLKAKWTPRTVQERNALYLYATTAMMGLEQAGIMTYMPVFLARLDASAEQIGLLTSIPAIVSMIVLIPAGLLAERIPNQVQLRGHSGFLMRSSFLLMSIAPWVFAASAIPSVAIVLWSLRALGFAVANSAWMTVMTDAIPARQRPRLNSIRWAMLSVVSAVLAAVFGGMLDVIVFPLNYQVLFLISFAGALLNLYFFSRIQVPPLQTKPKGEWHIGNLGQGIRSYLSSITECREFVRFLLATTAFRIAVNMSIPLFSLYWVNELQATDSWIGLRSTAGYTALVIGYLTWGRIAGRIKHRRVLLISVLLYGLYPISTALIPSTPWLLPVAVIWGVALSGVDMGLFDLMLAAAPKDKMPRLSSVLNLVSNAAAFIGPMLGVMLSNATSVRTALLVIGAIQLLSTITFRLLPSDV
ncbi:MAG: MFS transporter [Anaerolineae bacterium]|nr:MFS transporter [Anaerolineae bacterium]